MRQVGQVEQVGQVKQVGQVEKVGQVGQVGPVGYRPPFPTHSKFQFLSSSPDNRIKQIMAVALGRDAKRLLIANTSTSSALRTPRTGRLDLTKAQIRCSYFHGIYAAPSQTK